MKRILPLFSLLLFCAIPSRAAISLNSQSDGGSCGSCASPTSFTVTSSTGNLEIIVIVDDTADSVSACTDNHSASYTLSATHATSAGGNVYLCYLFSSASGVTSVSITHSGGHLTVSVYDCSSTSGGALDGSVTAYSAQSGANPAPQIVASGAGIAVVGMSDTANMTAAATPFTLDTINQGSINNYAKAAHDVNGAGGTLTCTITASSGTWSAIIAEFKEAGGAATVRRRGSVINK